VVDGVLWRASRPDIADVERATLVEALMQARRDVGRAENAEAMRDARDRVNAAKVALGERGPVWWTDEAPDFNRRKVANTPYAEWWAKLADG
jgi:hypothetical protein